MLAAILVIWGFCLLNICSVLAVFFSGLTLYCFCFNLSLRWPRWFFLNNLCRHASFSLGSSGCPLGIVRVWSVSIFIWSEAPLDFFIDISVVRTLPQSLFFFCIIIKVSHDGLSHIDILVIFSVQVVKLLHLPIVFLLSQAQVGRESVRDHVVLRFDILEFFYFLLLFVVVLVELIVSMRTWIHIH